MTTIILPDTIANGDIPDWDAVLEYFDAIATAFETVGLDNSNVKDDAGIAYSKLDLADKIETTDLKAESVDYTKIATPNVTIKTSTAVADGGMISGTAKETLSQAVPSDGFYLIVCSAEAFNTYHAAGVGAKLTSTLKIGGATNQNKHRDWYMESGVVSPDLYADFDHVIPAALASGTIVSHEFLDNASSHTQVASGGVRLYLIRLAAM